LLLISEINLLGMTISNSYYAFFLAHDTFGKSIFEWNRKPFYMLSVRNFDKKINGILAR
jgi:hypothetical protein